MVSAKTILPIQCWMKDTAKAPTLTDYVTICAKAVRFINRNFYTKFASGELWSLPPSQFLSTIAQRTTTEVIHVFSY